MTKPRNLLKIIHYKVLSVRHLNNSFSSKLFKYL